MSRSCQSATSSSAGTTAERTSRARPVRFSVERGIGPDATVHLDFALRRLASVIERLTLNVYGSNEDARAAYERAGFFPYEFAKAREDGSGLMVRMLKPL